MVFTTVFWKEELRVTSIGHVGILCKHIVVEAPRFWLRYNGFLVSMIEFRRMNPIETVRIPSGRRPRKIHGDSPSIQDIGACGEATGKNSGYPGRSCRLPQLPNLG